MSICVFFFFQAEDGIRDLTVTGVQTCALPICLPGTSATPDRSCAQTDVLTGSGLPAVGFRRRESQRKLAEVRKCKARIRRKTLDISALSAERRRRSVMDRSWN